MFITSYKYLKGELVGPVTELVIEIQASKGVVVSEGILVADKYMYSVLYLVVIV